MNDEKGDYTNQAGRQAIGQVQSAAMCGESIARGDRNAIGYKGSLGFTFSEALERIKTSGSPPVT